jgi:hypothetical protein
MSTVTAVRGDTIPIDIAVTVSDAVVSLVGATLFLTVRRYAADTAALWEGETDDGITHTDAANGEATATIPAGDSDDWPVGEPLPFDVQMKTAAGEIFTVASDFLMLTEQITTRTE